MNVQIRAMWAHRFDEGEWMLPDFNKPCFQTAVQKYD